VSGLPLLKVSSAILIFSAKVFIMPTWIYETTLQEWLREGHSSADLLTLTERAYKIYFVNGCVKRLTSNERSHPEVVYDIINGLEEISKFFLPST
jgi:hypothetical protein